jgi:hypothetical protein
MILPCVDYEDAFTLTLSLLECQQSPSTSVVEYNIKYDILIYDILVLVYAPVVFTLHSSITVVVE